MTENKRFERIYADVDVFCRDHNAKEASQLIERNDYDRIVDLLNELAEENKQLKQRCNEYWDSTKATMCIVPKNKIKEAILNGKNI